MKQSLTALIAGVLLFGLAASGHAYSYIVDMAGAPSTPLTSLPGVATTTGDLFYVTITPATAFEYSSPSVVSFGNKTTFPALPGAGQSGAFSASTDFFFYVGRSLGGVYTFGPDLIHGSADLSGPVAISEEGVPSSNAVFTNGTATVESGPNTGATSFLSVDPNNGLPANQINLTYDGTPVSVFIDLISSVPAPDGGALSISGYITDQGVGGPPVPEPGRMGLLLALGCTTILQVFRHRSGRPWTRSHEKS